ncbi:MULTISPECIES: metal ABC transporter solute-binding protein, Zn/Mn family [Anaerococcus]|uniref:metal ABC transporter solute-binding protein, Zn/Mn family n=1 Tax=Anaerococcus TaxID=165779 RepID=UPI00242E255C|nr:MULTISPECIES: zinc ABC transporter substrate-binding protein [Anaerococcus]MDD7766726.1 zinc ABC transporter substrate-binding protein [Anaerococcus vaginalis]MDY6127691.1 zinc ABC transporter substrate-binding protein [Anaerococcus sp.]
MKHKKTNLLAVFLIFGFIFLFGGCQKENISKKEDSSNKKLIYTSFFPVEELTKRIVGDKFIVKSIIDKSQEPHSFELKTDDIKNIIKADLVIYNGASMETFIDDLKNSSDNKEKVVEIDPKNKDYYKKNLDENIAKFKQLDKKFADELKNVDENKRYFVVSHAAFNYLADDYNLKQVAVTGISPEDEPSAKQLKTIADFVKKHDISTIFFEGKATPKVAETLAKSTNTKTSTLYTMENLTKEEAEMGYLKLMEKNLEALKESFYE